MKTIVILLLLITYSASYSQEYQVLHVKGKILRESDGSELKPGDKISEKEKIKFATRESMAAVLNKDKGRYILKATGDAENQNDLVYILKSTISPVRGGMSSRSAGINNDLDFQLYFSQAPYVWAGNVLKVAISSATYPMDKNRFFYIEYSFGGDWIGKKLGFENEFLIVDKEKLFQIDGKPIDFKQVTDYTLYYYDAITEESKKITDIEFVFISQAELYEIGDLFQPLNDDSYYQIAEVLSGLYGNCDPLQVAINFRK